MTEGLSTPDFLVIGHVCRDVLSGASGFRPGGSVFYAAATAARLGYSVGVVTAGGPEVDALRELPGTAVINLDTDKSTSFENVYEEGRRRQYLRHLAPAIPIHLVPAEWMKAPLVHIAPVANEVPLEMFRLFPKSLVGVTPQGYLRTWGPDREVHYRAWSRAAEALVHCAAVIFSEEDLDGHAADWLSFSGPLFVITRAELGCEVIYRGKHRAVPGFPQQAIDPTGAGDVFAAAFLLELKKVKEPLEAARFANCVASFCVSGQGVEGLPTMEQVSARLVGAGV